VQTALGRIQHLLKSHKQIPARGLVLFVSDDFELYFEPEEDCVRKFHYVCEKKFDVDAIKDLSESGPVYGFVIVTGNGLCLARVQGKRKHVLLRWRVTLPNKQARGGQSEQRFKRLVFEARHNYVTKALEKIYHIFLTNCQLNVDGLILAGNGDWTLQLRQRLTCQVVLELDIAGEMELGLDEAISKSSVSLQQLVFAREDTILQPFFDDIAKDLGFAIYGMQEIWDHRNQIRVLFVCRDANPFQWQQICEQDTKQDTSFITFIRSICQVEEISACTRLGNQLLKGFDGVGGLLFYAN
jgi:peptide chain release factor subunit 1